MLASAARVASGHDSGRVVLSEWGGFFAAAAGAGAALTGLIIVAVSGDVDRVITIHGMASRAGVAIASLVMVTLVALAALMPGISPMAYGVLVIVVGLVAAVFAVLSLRTLMAGQRERLLGAAIVKGSIALVPALCTTIGGLLLTSGVESGVFWVAFGALMAVVSSVLATWVILIEIRR